MGVGAERTCHGGSFLSSPSASPAQPLKLFRAGGVFSAWWAPRSEYGVGLGEAPPTPNIAGTWVAGPFQTQRALSTWPRPPWDPGGTQVQMAAWPVLPFPTTGPRTKQECPQETGYLSPGGTSGFPLAAPARMFCNELRESIHSGKTQGVECSLPAGVWVRGRRAACSAGAGWGGGEVGRGQCGLPGGARSSALGDFGLWAVYLSVCLSIWLRGAGWFKLVPQAVCLLYGTLSFVLFYF